MLYTKRAYESPSESDGRRFLVERLWPRGIRKENLVIDGWLKDVAPSPELRKWFHIDMTQWPEFRVRYLAELEANPEGWAPILQAARKGTVTLIYSAHDTEHNSAVLLKDFLNKHLHAKHHE